MCEEHQQRRVLYCTTSKHQYLKCPNDLTNADEARQFIPVSVLVEHSMANCQAAIRQYSEMAAQCPPATQPHDVAANAKTVQMVRESMGQYVVSLQQALSRHDIPAAQAVVQVLALVYKVVAATSATTVLLATHARCGAHSVLRSLPGEFVRSIAVLLCLPPPFPF
eukprot:TRINITY_DN3666_c0_g1_i4.p1 TRINITY_DN3666_c0_g1~~TRINITY_DN3666_c0_g1_i4.p1  ORF type:complete len:166 (+),score=39.28 TRINITY_DN3666_c0_g1_i4:95-592(+)